LRFFLDLMCVIVVCFFSSRFVIPNVSPQNKRTCRAEGLFLWLWFFFPLVRCPITCQECCSLSLSLSLGVWFLFYCVSVGGVTTVAAAASLLLLVKTLP
jgi:hypothetical protein